VRKDTGEIVRDEPMSALEHQNNLFEEKQPDVDLVDLAERVEAAGATEVVLAGLGKE